MPSSISMLFDDVNRSAARFKIDRYLALNMIDLFVALDV
jgi:hypothetical protein